MKCPSSGPVPTCDYQNRKLILAAASVATVAAFAPIAAPSVSTAQQESKADLVELQNSLPGPPGFWDPLGLAGSEILSPWLEGKDATIGFLRHAEIKHGRVAMAAFMGFIAQCTPIVSGKHPFCSRNRSSL